MKLSDLRQRRATLADQMRALVETAETGNRDLTDTERTQFDTLRGEERGLVTRIERAEQLRDAELGAAAERRAQDGSGRELGELLSSYRLTRALASMLPGNTGVDAGREQEVAAELRASNPGRKWRGLPVPSEIFTIPASQAPVRFEQRAASDYVVGGGNALSAQQYRPELYIDLLRASLLSAQLGVRIVNDLQGGGAVSIPKQTAGSGVFWVGEDTDVGHATGAWGSVALTPHTVGVQAVMSRRMLLTTTPSIENLVRADLAAAVAEGIDRALINGNGVLEPKGLLQYVAGDGLNVIAMGATGAAMTYLQLLNLFKAPLQKNVPTSRLAWASNTNITASLLATLRVAGDAAGGFVLNLDGQGQTPNLLGRPYYSSEIVPSNLVKSTGTGLSALILGDWSDAIIGFWSGLDVVLDPFSGAANGSVRLVVMQDCDVAFRRLGSFAVAKDIVA